jgi:hypothetical protein
LWDSHSYLENGILAVCDRTDQPVAGLLKDLEQRGLLESTLVVWGGEFGRLPVGQDLHPFSVQGRDHNPRGFTVWMAGGGVKGGTVYGSTDDVGYKAVENPVSIADFHATILHQLGLDYRKLFFEVGGKEERLTTDAEAKVVKSILV